VLEFVSKWGRNASPFKLANTYLRLNWKGISYWRDVRKAAKSVPGSADTRRRARTRRTDEQASAEAKLPSYPLQSAEKAGRF
jgi:hypothetical protein